MPKATELGGVIVPAVTNFDPRGESLDIAAFTANIQAYMDAGISGIVVAGSSGEGAVSHPTRSVRCSSRRRAGSYLPAAG